MIAMLLPFIFMIHIGILQAVTNFQIGLNIITELIVGFMLPGRPIAMMLFKAYGYAPMYQGLLFTRPLHEGPSPSHDGRPVRRHHLDRHRQRQRCCHGMAFGAINGICEAGNTNGFICPTGRSAFNSPVIFGVIGPRRIFGESGLYKNSCGCSSSARSRRASSTR